MSILRKFSFGSDQSDAVVHQIGVAQVYERLLSDRITLIDVRKPEEWSETGRPRGSCGATLQDGDFLKQVLAIMGSNKSMAVAFSCKTGGRSSEAAKLAKKAGHTDVYNVEGGFHAWASVDLPLDKAPF